MKKEIPKYHKPTDYRGIFVKRYYRYFGVAVAKAIKKTKITPNQVTILRALLIPVTGFLFSLESYRYVLMAGILLMSGQLIDFVDGSLARIKSLQSKLGAWLDDGFDRLVIPVCFLGVAVGHYIRNSNQIMFIAILLSLISYEYISYISVMHLNEEVTTKNKGIKRIIIENMFYNSYFIVFGLFVSSIFNVVDKFIYFCAIYGTLSSFISFIIFYNKMEDLIW